MIKERKLERIFKAESVPFKVSKLKEGIWFLLAVGGALEAFKVFKSLHMTVRMN